MNSTKIAEYLSKLLIEDDESDLIRFTFPDDTRKIKCSKSMLSEISPVFQRMFSETWLKETTIKFEDDVTFNQYSSFKLFLEIIYELREMNSVSVDEVTAVYFYAHKYEVIDTTNKIQSHLNKRLKDGLSRSPLSVAELNNGLQFAETYQLDDFKKKLDKVKLDFDEEDPVQFFHLAVAFQMMSLKEQIIQHLKTIEPKDTWTLEISHLVLKCLQKERKKEYRCVNCRSKHSSSSKYIEW